MSGVQTLDGSTGLGEYGEMYEDLFGISGRWQGEKLLLIIVIEWI